MGLSIIIYALCTSSLFYLGSRALITRFAWSRYPPAIAVFMDCSACSGTWYGALLAYVGGFWLHMPFLGLRGDSFSTVAVVALCSTTWTPIVAGLAQHGFDTLGHVAPIDDLPLAEPHGEQSKE